MFPKLISYGDYFLPTYGVLVALAFLAGLSLTGRLARKAGYNQETVTNLAIYCALSGLAGAKLLMFAFDWRYYWQKPSEMFSLATLQAAGVYQGGLVLAVVFAWFYLRRHNLPFFGVADAFAPGVAHGHALGRLGCFAAGCCWGSRCDRPWAVTFTNPEAEKLVGVPLGVPLHPSQLYESFAEFLLSYFLYRQFLKKHGQGEIIGLYLILYSLIRFFVEFVRNHEQSLPFGLPFSITQWIAAGTLSIGVWWWRRAVRSKA